MTKYIYKNFDGAGALNDTCLICESSQYNDWVLCDGCNFYFHPQCLGLDPKTVMESEDDFFCTDCANKSSTQTQGTEPNSTPNNENNTWDDFQLPSNFDEPDNENQCQPLSAPSSQNTEIYQQASGEQCTTPQRIGPRRKRTASSKIAPHLIADNDSTTDTDDDGYSEIKAIKNVRKIRGKREFLVTYRSNQEDEWLPEHAFDKAVTSLKQFLEKNPHLSPTKLREDEDELVGAKSTKQANRANWVTMTEVAQKAKAYGDPKGLSIEVFGGKLGKEDKILLVKNDVHCHTALFLAKKRMALIADGENAAITNNIFRLSLVKKLHGIKKFKFLHFNKQREADQCGSSAAAIAIEFQNIYKYMEERGIPTEVAPPVSRIDRVRKVLHKEPGPKLNPPRQIEWLKKPLQCERCGKSFKSKNRNVFNFHKCPEI